MHIDVAVSPNRRRRILQIIFVFVNLAMVEAHVPGPLWLAIGGIFWIALVFVTAAGSSLVCGTMCWVGAIQDFAEPLARSRVRIDPRWGRGITLGLLSIWIPAAWFFFPHASGNDSTPLNLDPSSWHRHLFGIALALAIAASVTFLGKRGICRFLCPFNSVVGAVRRRAFPMAKATPPAEPECGLGRPTCSGCARGSSRTQILEPKGRYL